MLACLLTGAQRLEATEPAFEQPPSTAHGTRAAAAPNVLLILADDLGYSDLGCYGSEIETPVLDQLARNGLRYTAFYNTTRCWPSRAALLTGYYPQQVRRDTVPGVISGGRGVRPEWARLLPVFLKQAGYRSYHSGKWHIDGLPVANGFDRSYLLQDQGRFFSPKNHLEDDVKLAPVEPGTAYYATTAIAEHAIRCLKEHAASHADRPFFHFLAFTAPHFPLHALPADIAKYRERYRAGWDTIRQQRYERQRREGFAVGRLSPAERELGPPYHLPESLQKLGPHEVNRPLPWADLTDGQRLFQAEKMAIHAAMVHRMDIEIGRVVEQLKAMRAFENTLILFLSDNGASAEIMVRDDGHDPEAPAGSARTYLCLGPGWSTTANTPFRRHKTWVHEGGVSTPLVAHWPKGITARGELRHTLGHVTDIAPTLLELAGVKPRVQEGEPRGPRPPGQSLVASFGDAKEAGREEIWFGHESNRALRLGTWKIVAAGKSSPWELYDIARDRSETENLAAAHPDRVASMAKLWETRFEEFTRTATETALSPKSPR